MDLVFAFASLLRIYAILSHKNSPRGPQRKSAPVGNFHTLAYSEEVALPLS
jgi:hypothetical protein